MIQKPRGTKDIYGLDVQIYQNIFQTFETIAHQFNLQRIITPMFEAYELFRDTTGEVSDIVQKEIYKFEDFGKRLLALRPEGTAPVGRAIIENKLFLEKKYNKLYYIGSMFRYERPQKGRLRQFYQIGVELIQELNVYSVLETILIGHSFLQQLQINDYKLVLNSLGLLAERQAYVEELKTYFTKRQAELSATSQKRIATNPLRILDDKVDNQLPVVQQAPKINQFWSQQSQNEFSQLLQLLDLLKIDYEIDYSLVRGLDYYSNIVFEFVSDSEHLGEKATLIGGGCYLDLVHSKSNPINGVGFGCGVERLFEIIKGQNQVENTLKVDLYFILENEKQYQIALPLIHQLRALNYQVEFNYIIKKYNKLFQEANYFQAQLIIFQELNQQQSLFWTIKKGQTKTTCQLDQLIATIEKLHSQ